MDRDQRIAKAEKELAQAIADHAREMAAEKRRRLRESADTIPQVPSKMLLELMKRL